MNVLIFGCDGFVGNYLSKEFYLHGYKVYGAGLLNVSNETNTYLSGYSLINILDFESVRGIIADVNPDYVINLAAISSVGQSWHMPQKVMNINTCGTLNILDAICQLKINPKVLLVGSSEEYSPSLEKLTENSEINAGNPYAISKVAQEQFAKIYRDEYGMNIVCTRTFNHTGLGQSDNFVIPSFVKQTVKIQKRLQEPIISVGNLSIKRDFGDVRDMASAYRLILETDLEDLYINVGSGSCFVLEELLKYIISLTDKEIQIVVDDSRIRPTDNPVVWCDNSLLKKATGWEPKYTIFDAINEIYAYMMSLETLD